MRTTLLLTAVLSLGFATGARAQWDTPAFLPPRPGDDVGIYLSDQRDFGIYGIWRQGGNLNLGLRVGYIDTPGDGVIVVAAETWNAIFSAGPDFPVDVSWTLGVGAGFNGGTVLEIPGGVTIGRAFVLSPLTFQVYGHPRLALVVTPDAADEVDLWGLLDLGADVHVTESTKLRLGATLGEKTALGVGLAFNFGRSAAVR